MEDTMKGLVSAKSIEDLISIISAEEPPFVSGERRTGVQLNGIKLEKREDMTDEQADRLTKGLRAVAWLSKLTTWKSDLGVRWAEVLAALGSNHKGSLHTVRVDGSGVDSAAAIAFAASIHGHPTLQRVSIAGEDPPLGELAIEKLAESMLSCKKPIERFLIAKYVTVPLSPRAMKWLCKLQLRYPNCLFGEGRPGKVLRCQIATAIIDNDDAANEVKREQANLLVGFENDSEGEKKAAVSALKKIAEPEQKRLLKLLDTFVYHKYASLGGFEFLIGADENVAWEGLESFLLKEENKQSMPSSLVSQPEKAVRFLLAKATTMQARLEELLAFVSYTIGILKTPVVIVPLVDTLVEGFDLKEVAIDVPSFELKGKQANESFLGCFEFDSYEDGRPAFRHKTTGKYLYWNESTKCWFANTRLGSTRGHWHWKEDTTPGERVDSPTYKWRSFKCGDPQDLTLTHSVSRRSLRDAMVEFLKKRQQDDGMQEMLGLEGELVRISIGPPKSFQRALDKVNGFMQGDWGGNATDMVDVNRATLTFDSPAMLMFAYYLIKHKVEVEGGKITRLSNYFLNGEGTPTRNFEQPPCVHLNIRMHDWIHEIMLMFVDIEHVKQDLHKFYQIVRAENADEVLMPIFK